MIEMVPSLPPTPIKTPAAALSPARAGDFVQSLAGFLDSLDPAARPATQAAERKAPAATGKPLPQGEKDNGTIDPALIWMPVVPAAPASVASSPFGAATDVPLEPQGATPSGALMALTPPGSPGSPAEIAGESLGVLAGDALDLARAPASDAVTPGIGSALATTVSGTTTPAINAPPRDTPPISVERDPPTPLVALSPTLATTPIQPAGHAFAAAIAGAALDQPPYARGEDARDPAAPLGALQPDATPVAVVQPTAASHRAPLDLAQGRGLRQMIDHIETLRDDADARDTRIRLVPDALGSVDVAVRREGEAVHVHFTAEVPATRALLSEAQPRLAELASARGLTLAGATVDSGSGGHTAPHRHPAAAPANVARETSPDFPETADCRVA